jgi:hypothetical protein
MKVDIELTRTSDAEDLVQSLSAKGIEAELAEPDRVTAKAEDFVLVEHAVEEWAADRGLPFVPMQVDDRRVVVSPPGA